MRAGLIGQSLGHSCHSLPVISGVCFGAQTYESGCPRWVATFHTGPPCIESCRVGHRRWSLGADRWAGHPDRHRRRLDVDGTHGAHRSRGAADQWRLAHCRKVAEGAKDRGVGWHLLAALAVDERSALHEQLRVAVPAPRGISVLVLPWVAPGRLLGHARRARTSGAPKRRPWRKCPLGT